MVHTSVGSNPVRGFGVRDFWRVRVGSQFGFGWQAWVRKGSKFGLRVRRTLANPRCPFLSPKSANFWSNFGKKLDFLYYFLLQFLRLNFSQKICRFLTQKTTKFSSILCLGKSPAISIYWYHRVRSSTSRVRSSAEKFCHGFGWVRSSTSRVRSSSKFDIFGFDPTLVQNIIFSNEMEKKPRYHTYFSIQFGKIYRRQKIKYNLNHLFFYNNVLFYMQ